MGHNVPPEIQAFESMLRARGAHIIEVFEEYGQGIAKLDGFMWRYRDDRVGPHVEIADARTFDRWANSVDWMCGHLPDDDAKFSHLLGVLEEYRPEKPDWTVRDTEDVTNAYISRCRQ